MIFGTPQEAGWTRRPDMDSDEFIVWQTPGGGFVPTPRDAAVTMVPLDYMPDDNLPDEVG